MTADSTPRTALVTGGGSGIGRAAALALAAAGHDVLVVGRREQPLRDTAAAHPGIRHLVADVSTTAGAEAAVDAAVEAHGRLDVLVNNAAILVPAPLEEIDEDAAQQVWRTNILAPALLAKAALPHLAAARGAIVNVSSSFGSRPAPGASLYGASKAALEQLTRSWALELADRGVRVNAIAPGPTESEALARTGLPDEVIERIKAVERSRVPLGRRGTPEDVARWVVAFADPAAGWITGQVLGVDGGFGLR
ncbi:NAD(P)-dependent dehydrogenase, short-chain alcohol dehydrogenase family [Pseudonocardia thermophila]|jgi:Dehydrogenases with different specificities (related to short-chain alcohol dehydrogenases)|uniref:NAD(P)-dependent dehydrogenase, short-chain alcohol dehydrogenase family n=1 Tax=Pseudonocardia thermophila TaxID=1848 RepID=A0A1M6VS80_PSETH|nr:SDR family oxidoreductase [Pseudonocardia thermophila]SHK84244.1 NAD(P)-dependent dehydrogenase, short-chain alcohol dehydrogenase family [Pseudonocardia thermophila]